MRNDRSYSRRSLMDLVAIDNPGEFNAALRSGRLPKADAALLSGSAVWSSKGLRAHLDGQRQTVNKAVTGAGMLAEKPKATKAKRRKKTEVAA